MMKIYFVSRDEYGWGKQMELAELAELLRPLLQPAPADVPSEAEQLRYWKAAADAARANLSAADKRREVAERQLADAQQANAQLTAQLAEAQKTAQGWEFQWKTERSNSDFWKAAYDDTQRERDIYRAQADAARQAATVAAQRADAAEAKWAAIPWAAITCWVYSDTEAGKWLNANRPAAQD